MPATREVKFKQNMSGWGGFHGVTTVIEVVQFDEVDGKKVEDISKSRNLGLILESGKFTPVTLLTDVSKLQSKGVIVSEATAGMLALAKVPTPFLKPGTD